MHVRAHCLAIIAAALLLSRSVPVQGQADSKHVFAPHLATLSGWIGGAAYSDFHQGQVRTAGTAEGSRDLDRRLSAETGIAFSAAATYWVSSVWGVRAHGSYAPTRFQVLHDAGAGPVEASEDAPPARLDVWLFDLDLLFRAPVILGRVMPYGIVGAGRVVYSVAGPASSVPAEAKAAFARGRRSGWAAVAGLGAVIPLDRRDLFLSFEVTDHITRRPVTDVPPFAGDDSTMEFDPEGVDGGGEGFTSNLRISVGLSLPVRLRR